ncbi:MAG: alpha/beta hydrolase [Isosphaeraceae bacterium]
MSIDPMRRVLALPAVLAAFFLSAGPKAVPAQEAAASKVTTENDVVYTKAGDAELKLDLARPSTGDGPFPAVLVIHGGAWRGGNKSSNRPLLTRFAERGYVAVSPQYRFCPKELFPAQVHDVKAAVRWLKAHAKEYRIDPDRVGAVGFSAGAHLALMLGLTSAADGLEGDAPAGAPDTKVSAVVNFFGPTELSAPDIPDVSRPLVRDFLGGSPEEKPEAAKKASPITYISKDDPPVLTFQGTKDPLVPHTQATRLVDAMTAAGVPGRVELLIGAGHGWQGDQLNHTLAEMFAFFDANLKKPSK